MNKILNGNEVSLSIKEQVKDEVAAFNEKDLYPSLAVIIVGNDPASKIYVRNKKRACEFTGIKSLEYSLPENTSQSELLELIKKLNEDKGVNGILCQLPLPGGIDEREIIESIAPEKDVDAFSYQSTGRLWQGSYDLASCTPMGVMEMLDYYEIDPRGKNAVIVGRSDIVGKPMAALLLERDATVTICHSKTENLSFYTKNADILVAAVGKAEFIKADMIKEGAVVIDVGINRMADGTLKGDVEFEKAKEAASFITPVPGGCGPMTIAMLMKNTLTAFKKQNLIEE